MPRPSSKLHLPKLLALQAELIRSVTEGSPIREGVVLTPAPPPYRRLDCDGRALAYVRTRPSKQCVRVDVSALWIVPPLFTDLRIPTAAGATAFLAREVADVALIAEFLRRTVELTRAREHRSRARLLPHAGEAETQRDALG